MNIKSSLLGYKTPFLWVILTEVILFVLMTVALIKTNYELAALMLVLVEVRHIRFKLEHKE